MSAAKRSRCEDSIVSAQSTDSYLALQTEADLQQLIDDRVVESEVLDFKGALYPEKSGPWTSGHEFAKDVEALANNRGGLLILGMEHLKGVASRRSPITGQSSETAEQRLRQWLIRYSAPPVRIVVQEIVAEETDGFYLIVKVPRTSSEPHAVSMPGSRSLSYPARHGQDTRYLSEHEVARRYNDRFQGQALRRGAFDQLVLDGANNLDRRSSIWLWLAIRPDEPLSSRLDTETARATRERFAQGHLSGPIGSRLESSQAGGTLGRHDPKGHSTRSVLDQRERKGGASRKVLGPDREPLLAPLHLQRRERARDHPSQFTLYREPSVG